MLLAFCVTRLYIPIFFSECGHTHFGGGGGYVDNEDIWIEVNH